MNDLLTLPEKTAIELKYLGNIHKDIAEKLNIPQRTIDDWFSSSGKLYTAYREFVIEMNEKRQAEMEKKIAVSDEEFFITTTNAVRMVAKSMQPYQVLLVDKKGNAVAGPDGKPQYVMREPDPMRFDLNDLKTAWQIQRLMQGKPINYEKQDIETTSFQTDMVVKELGLTDEDFTDERISATRIKIQEYLFARKRGTTA